MFSNVIVVVHFLALQLQHGATDLCNWTGSGFAAAADSRLVLQVRLRCTEGSVRWVYPGQALRVVLEPNLSSNPRTTVCIKPSPSLRGASVFVERGGDLELLATDDARSQQQRRQVFCFRADGPRRPAIYLQASPRGEGHWSRRTMGFRYELLGNRSSAPSLGLRGPQTSCRPCNDTELLMAVCNSDFGGIQYHQQGKATELVAENTFGGEEQEQTSRVVLRRGSERGRPLSLSHHRPRPWETEKGSGCRSLFVLLPTSTVVHFAASV
ncbi:meteorin-like protein isoform X3 [Scophthalmus maximus]|uniref:meteorin-like protein isoform X3 n=1 Tax=Scophthalmus maximus TaxID=52904 RepID=UPI0015E0B407|nr:meteorin-like protein isoform X3 [Scophthalmus maximus]